MFERAKKKAKKKAAKKFLMWAARLVGLKVGLIALLILVLVIVVAGIAAQDDQAQPQGGLVGPVDDTVFDAGNIISDAVFFDADAMTAQEIQAFLEERSPTCSATTCLRNMKLTTPSHEATELCAAYQGGAEEAFSLVLYKMAQACQINPQVLLTTIEKESGGLSKVNPPAGWDAAMFGFACPDTGPGGSANCSAEYAGVVPQTWGLAQQFQKYTKNPGKYNYKIGQNEILYNVVEQCQERKTVNIVNQATANLYIYTPYTPSDESLAAFPAAVTGPAAACASYGNRNFWNLFRKYFGTTGGGRSAVGGPGGAPGSPIVVNGPRIQLPAAAGVVGEIVAPNVTTAKAIAAGLSQLGVSYSWGGGNAKGPSLGIKDGCSDACITYEDWTVVGYDCAGLMLYSWAQVGVDAPRGSQVQARSGKQVPYAERIAGDMIGFVGHIAMYIGNFDGVDYMLEAPGSGNHVRVAKVRSDHYANVARIWEGLP